MSETTGVSASTSAASSCAAAASVSAIVTRSSPGPYVLRSAVPSALNRITSAISERNASSERASTPSTASATSGERVSARLAS